MIHYHGTPITPKERLYELAGRHFCVSYAAPGDLRRCHELGQSVMLDNGAFSAWTQGRTVDWRSWAAWAEPWLDYHTTWLVLPDSVDGGIEENDRLLDEWEPCFRRGVPVWHLHEPVSRLVELCMRFDRVCFGSSGAYRVVGDDRWHLRMAVAFNAITDADGRVPVWTHMLRGMSLSGSEYPFASVDSTDLARNHNRAQNGIRQMADRWDTLQNPARWTRVPEPQPLFKGAV